MTPAATATAASTAGPAAPAADRRPWRAAALFAVPYLILMLCWAFSGPPNTGPDEADHLVKAIGMSRLNIGHQYLGPPLGPGVGMDRNRSISRVIEVPLNLAPSGFNCELRKADVSAGCLRPQPTVTSTELILYVDPLGSYPPFLYAPIGWAVRLASSSTGAFLIGRLFCALACFTLLLLGSAHLIRWLGRRALLGAYLCLTPTVVFCSSIVTTSGMEICAAFATACVVVAALRRRESLLEPGSQLLLAGVGATLILSRQLGVVTFALLMLLLVIRLGPRFFLGLVTGRRPAVLVSAAALLTAAVSILVWERVYDHPSHVGSVLDATAFGMFNERNFGVLRSGVALFGWLDTRIPDPFVLCWIAAFVVLLAAALLRGSRADRWTLVLWSAVVFVVAYVTYATVFYPVGAGLQGRHLLAVFLLLPLLAGVAVAEGVTRIDAAIRPWVFGSAAVVVPVVQWVSLYVNGRRYAVGSDGPVWFLSAAQWQPPLGWVVWLIAGAIAAGALARGTWVAGRTAAAPGGRANGTGRPASEGVPAGVER